MKFLIKSNIYKISAIFLVLAFLTFQSCSVTKNFNLNKKLTLNIELNQIDSSYSEKEFEVRAVLTNISKDTIAFTTTALSAYEMYFVDSLSGFKNSTINYYLKNAFITVFIPPQKDYIHILKITPKKGAVTKDILKIGFKYINPETFFSSDYPPESDGEMIWSNHLNLNKE